MPAMIPSLRIEATLRPDHRAYLDALRGGGFTGDIRTDYATRLTAATDNSVYQVTPQAVVCPRTTADLALVARLLDEPRFHRVSVCARGGGTGTDGSALTEGVVVDTSRHMTRILEINAQERWARVQPGVTLAQLNKAAKPLGLFFAPNVAPGDRATLGGMISTDAAGEGSRVYGKTSSHILDLTSVFIGGVEWNSRELTHDDLESLKQRDDLIGAVHRDLDDLLARDHDLIERTVPKLWRFASGYNLGMVRTPGSAGVENGAGGAGDSSGGGGVFNLNWLLSGAEGTLGFVAEARLRLTPLPRHFAMVVMKYASFDEALGAAEALAAFRPRAIETMDEKLIDLARTDESWLLVRDFLDDPTTPMRAVNMVEFASDDADAVRAQAEQLAAHALARAGRTDEATGCAVVLDTPHREAMWNLRKRAVGLLGALPGRRKPVPFIEDAAVPPENLRAFMRELREILDRRGLDYGVYGHVDVGCMHLRPALDMTDPEDEALLRPITDEVARLVHRYGGILWGEHGKGYRSEYNPLFFGNDLYNTMRRVKGVFDPRNQFNPGKIATPFDDDAPGETTFRLATIESPTRGSFDRQIAPHVRQTFDDALRCNGNGQCFSDDVSTVMCPSWKGTRDRIHSPKGRSVVFREWLRLLALNGHELKDTHAAKPGRFSRESDPDDFSHEVYDAMQGCLACKACSGQCPVKVDVPEFRAAFLQAYHTRYRRPLRDRLIGDVEARLPLAAKAPRLANALQNAAPVRALMRRVGLVDLPPIATPTLRTLLRERAVPPYNPNELRAAAPEQRAQYVLIVQDAFSTFYTPTVVARFCDLLTALGMRPRVLPYRPGGKGLHVRGYLREFERVARAQAAALRDAASLGADLVGVDPAVTLMYRHEYLKTLDTRDPGFHVEAPQEWLTRRLPGLPRPTPRGETPEHALLLHCTERALTPESVMQWRDAFALLGLRLRPIAAGCCGMGGAWGHEAMHRENSKGIFDLSWAKRLEEIDAAGARPITTGYSCRSQTKRFGAGRNLPHPIEALCDALSI
ncbi:MAG: FAD-binding oxidoreductase [Phycisphaerales bacterium]|nr:MAG: FAD-binding oxidoreductase [Phycisphaerales bacterium]